MLGDDEEQHAGERGQHESRSLAAQQRECDEPGRERGEGPRRDDGAEGEAREQRMVARAAAGLERGPQDDGHAERGRAVAHRVRGVVAERGAGHGENGRDARHGLRFQADLAREAPPEAMRREDEEPGEERADYHRRAEREADREEQGEAGREDPADHAVMMQEKAAAEARRRLEGTPREIAVGERAALQEVRRRVDDARPAPEVRRDVRDREQRRAERRDRDRAAIEEDGRSSPRERGERAGGGEPEGDARGQIRRRGPHARERRERAGLHCMTQR